MDPLWLFTLLAFGIMVVPGMDMALVLSSALAGGRRAGFAAVAGMVAGGAAHVAMGTLGVGLLLQLWPAAFNVVLVAGAAYVAWIGWSLWRFPGTLSEPATGAPDPLRRTFGQAVATCLLNPKAYLFMVAVFPQFIAPDRPLLPQALALGAVIALAQASVYGTVAAGAGWLREGLRESEAGQRLLGRAVALLLLATAGMSVLQAWRG